MDKVVEMEFMMHKPTISISHESPEVILSDDKTN